MTDEENVEKLDKQTEKLVGTTKTVAGGFELREEYYIHGIVMILLPLSIFLFLFLIVIKLVCFLLADNNGVLRGDLGGRGSSKRYG